jgi:ribonuclease P protein subunit POP4
MKKQIYPYGLIGKRILVVEAKNESQKGFEGKIVDETRETISIEIESGEVKKLIKANINFMDLSTREIIKGRIIAKRPEERLKK